MQKLVLFIMVSYQSLSWHLTSRLTATESIPSVSWTATDRLERPRSRSMNRKDFHPGPRLRQDSTWSHSCSIRPIDQQLTYGYSVIHYKMIRKIPDIDWWVHQFLAGIYTTTAFHLGSKRCKNQMTLGR